MSQEVEWVHPAVVTGRVQPEALALRVSQLRVDELVFGMVPPLVLAGRNIASREYLVIQATLEDGSIGTGYVLTRGQPIANAAHKLAEQLTDARLADLFSLDVQEHGRSDVQRARAVLDQAAWDLLGQAVGAPVWSLLGEPPRAQPALLVAGYGRSGETDRSFAERVVGWRERGYRWVKLAGELHAQRTAGVLRELRRLAPAQELRVVVDVGFAGTDHASMSDRVRAWEEFDLTWVEDPFPVGAASEIGALRSESPGLVAAGDEASRVELEGLLQHHAVDVLRADSTTVGGLSGLAMLAEATDVPLSFHVYPEIHRHLAFVMPGISPVELFPPGDEFDFVDRFIRPDGWVQDGVFSAPEGPGMGLRYDPERVSARVVRSATYARDHNS